MLPLDDRFAERFAENAERHRGARTRFVFWAGMGHVPTDVAPDLRSRSYTIKAEVIEGGEGVLLAHGDATSGYSLYVQDGSAGPRPVGRREPPGGPIRPFRAGGPVGARRSACGAVGRRGVGTLTIDGEECGSFETDRIFVVTISWSGLDVGRDRASPVSDYDAPFAFTGRIRRVTVDLDDDQALDHDAVGRAETARE